MQQRVLWCNTHECQVIQDRVTNRAWCVMGDDQDDEEHCSVRAMQVSDDLTTARRNRWMF